MQLINSIKALLGIDRAVRVQSQIIIQSYNQAYPAWTSWKVIKAYKILDDIFSVVNRIATTAAAIPVYGYNQDMEDLAGTDKLAVFLRSLTYNQRFELFTWASLRGECFILKQKTLGVNGSVEKIYFLNPNYTTVVLSDTFPREIVGYRYCDANQGVDNYYPADEVIFIKRFNPSDDYLEAIRGLSNVDVLWQRLTRMESNMKNSVSQMQNGGVPGVMFFKDIPNTTAGKQAIDMAKTNIGKYFVNPDNKGAPLIQAGEVGYIPMGLSLVDLDSIELEKIDFKKVCNTWGVSDRLFNNDATGSEISDDNAQEGLYINAVIPLLTLVEDAFNTELVTDFGVGVRQVKFDVSGVWVLQKIMLQKVKVLSESPVMIPNDVLEAMGYERNPDPTMDMPLIKTGYQPIDQFEPLPPIE